VVATAERGDLQRLMLRGLATAAIVLLLGLNLWLPNLDLGRRGAESRVRADIDGAVGSVGQRLPELRFLDLDDGSVLRLADLRGHLVVLTFERSIDW
jgi:hypothetical protein